MAKPSLGLARRAVAARAARGPRRPDPARAPRSLDTRPWHVRTLIVPLPGGDPVRLLFVNRITGRVGVAGFDDVPAAEPGHLVVLAFGPDARHAATFSFDPAAACSHPEPDVDLVRGEGWSWQLAGSWPDYDFALRVEPWALEAEGRATCREPVTWWSDTAPLYSHYSAFSQTRGRLRLGGRAQDLAGWCSLEHGTGGNVPGVRLPASLFHYQLGALDGGEVFALGTFSGAGVSFFRRGVLLDAEGRARPLESWELDCAERAEVPDRCGGSIQVPTRFSVRASSRDADLQYEAEPLAEPVAGRGRLTSGGVELTGALDGRPVTGAAYVEHLQRPGLGRLTALAATLALLSSPAPADAACPVEGVAGGLLARVDAVALGPLEAALPDLIPESLAIPEESYTAFTCSGAFEDTILTPHDAEAAIRVVDVHLRLAEGALEVTGTLDIEVTGQLEMQLCALPNATCPARVLARGVAVRGRVEPRVESCSPVTPLTALELVANPETTTVELTECDELGELWDTVYDWFEDALLDALVGMVEPLVAEELPPVLEAFTAELVSDGMELGGLALSAVPETLEVRPDAVTVTFTADALPVGAPGACLPAGVSLPEEGFVPLQAPVSDAMVSLALSRPLVQRAVRAAWLAGWLCFDSRDYDLDLETPLQLLAPGVEVSAQVVVETPPAVDWDPAGQQVTVRASGVRVDLGLEAPGSPPSLMSATLDLAVTGEAAIDPEVQALVVRPVGVVSRGAIVTAPGATLAFSAATLQAVVDNALLPAFADSLGRLPLLGNLFVTAPVAVRMEEVATTSDALQVDLELWPRDPKDGLPPETVVAAAPPFPSPTDPVIGLGSRDDGTPARFLRHRVTVDGVTDEDWYGGTEVRLSGLEHGPHDLTVAAVDLNDNADPTAEALWIFVDALPPTVSLAPPGGVVRQHEAVFVAVASDETTPATELSLSYTLGRLDPAGGPDLPLAAGPVPSGGRIVLTDLPEDVIVRLTATATDAAGNQGEARVAFFANVEPTLGCRTAPGGGPGWAGPLLLLLLLGLSRRRAVRAGCLLALLCLPRPVAALHLGGVFGGTVRAAGASAYWNPAAMAASPEAWGAAAELVGFISHASYARAGRHPGTGEPYEAVEFSAAVPNFAFTLAAPTPVPWLQLVGGGFSVTAAGVDWPEDGPQRYHATRSYVLGYAATVGALVRPVPEVGVAVTAGPMLGLLHVNYAIDLGAFANDKLPAGARPLPLEDPLLEGMTHVNADDWGWVVALGAWARPTGWLRLGLGLLVPSDLVFGGTVDVDGPQPLEETLPGFSFGAAGTIEVEYALGWELHLEAEAEWQAWTAALLWSYTASGRRDLVVSTIEDADVMEGRQLTVPDKRDDWLLGLRLSRRLDPEWEVALRADVDPLSIPHETMHAGNLDFASLQLGAGVRWSFGRDQALELGYTALLAWDNEVETSVFDPDAPRESGLGGPSANGTYGASAHVLSLGVSGVWGE